MHKKIAEPHYRVQQDCTGKLALKSIIKIFITIIAFTLQRHFELHYVFPEKNLRGLSPNFRIHVSVSDLYIPTNYECMNWDSGRAVPFLGIYASNFRYSIFAVQFLTYT
jgi:hypothetical protein